MRVIVELFSENICLNKLTDVSRMLRKENTKSFFSNFPIASILTAIVCYMAFTDQFLNSKLIVARVYLQQRY